MAEVSQEDFEQAISADLGSVAWDTASDDVSPTEASGEETIGGGGGGVDTIVNVASTVIELMNNSASISSSEYANAIPQGVDAMQITGWQGSPHKITLTWRASSDWWRVWEADYNFTVGISFYYGGEHNGAGRYLDYVSPYLDVSYLPPDFSVDVRCVMPNHGMNLGTRENPVAALPIDLTVTLKGFFSQLVSFSHRYQGQVQGTGGGNWM
jgi:hypothetical protein